MLLRLFCWLFAATILATSLHARSDTRDDAAPTALVYRNIGGRELKLFSFPSATLSDAARPAILMVQGGAWSRGTPEQLFRPARYFAQNGFLPVVVGYRLADAVNSPVESFSDVCYALAFLRRNAQTLGVVPSRIAAWGISSSGQLVASAATLGCGSAEAGPSNGGPDALLLISPVVDAVSDGLFRRLMEGHANPASFSPTHTLTRSIAPTLITQGDADQTTPIGRSKVFCDLARKLRSHCELVAFGGQGHVLDRASRDQALELQVTFLRKAWQ